MITEERARQFYSLGAYEFSPGDGREHPNDYLEEFDAWLQAERMKAWDEGYVASLMQSKGITGPVRNPYLYGAA